MKKSLGITLVGTLKKYTQGQEKMFFEPEGECRVSELLEELGIPSPLVAIVLVNGKQVSKDYALKEGDEVKLIPLVGGGQLGDRAVAKTIKEDDQW